MDILFLQNDQQPLTINWQNTNLEAAYFDCPMALMQQVADHTPSAVVLPAQHEQVDLLMLMDAIKGVAPETTLIAQADESDLERTLQFVNDGRADKVISSTCEPDLAHAHIMRGIAQTTMWRKLAEENEGLRERGAQLEFQLREHLLAAQI